MTFSSVAPATQRTSPSRFEACWPGYVPFGLSREQAARHAGLGTTKFDQMVAEGRMPEPVEADGRVLWIRDEIEAAVRALPRRRNKRVQTVNDNDVWASFGAA